MVVMTSRQEAKSCAGMCIELADDGAELRLVTGSGPLHRVLSPMKMWRFQIAANALRRSGGVLSKLQRRPKRRHGAARVGSRAGDGRG